MSTDPSGRYMMSNCGSVYSISADVGVCVKRGATLSRIRVWVFSCIIRVCYISMYDNSVPLQKRLVGRLASSIVKIFSFSPSQPSLIMLSFVFSPLLPCFLSFHLSLSLPLSRNFTCRRREKERRWCHGWWG